MIRVLVSGGLGNQLFQYAAGRALALRHNTGLTLDLRFIERSGRSAASPLEALPLPVSYSRYTGWPDPHSLIRRAGRKVWQERRSTVFQNMELRYDPEFEALPANSTLSGYFQSEKYFCSAAEGIKAELTAGRLLRVPKAVRPLLEDSSTVVVHVRRGDYVTSATFSLQGIEQYYDTALRVAAERLSRPTFLFFSDDLPWCHGHFKALPFATEFADSIGLGCDPIDDMLSMSLASTHITANSSFSWWAAWLSASIHRRVLAPSRWVNAPGVEMSDLLPPSWERIAF